MTAQKIICLITFDYELCLGRNFLPVDEVLFKPTERAMEICAAENVSATFFADVCSVWAHRKSGLDQYADQFESQLKGALGSGHDVQLHLHPHWLASRYVNGKWLISTDKMYLSELGFGDGEDSAAALVSNGVSYLNRLLQPVDSGYRCLAFRAAGLALQPGARELIKILLENGIRVDTSVAKNLVLRMDTVTIDYTHTPEPAFWFISPDTGIETPAREGILEIPVGTFQSDLGTRIGFLWRRAGSIRQMRGTTISRSKRQSKLANIRSLVLENLRYLHSKPSFILSCDTKGFSLKMLLDGFHQYVTRHHRDNVIMVSMANHPKLMFEDQMTILASFIRETRKRYDIRFATCTQAANLRLSTL